jgi:hypothetical protein
MSAFIVNDRHIEALIHFVQGHESAVWLTRSLHAHVDERAIADILRAENVRSVRARYGAKAAEMFPDAPVVLRPPSQRAPRLSPVAAIKACDCYDYQACETPDYDKTTAAAIIRVIRSAAVAALPGYEEAAWEVSA